MDDPLDGRIGEGWSGGAERQPHQRRRRAQRIGDGRGAGRRPCLAAPRTSAVSRCLELGTQVRPTTLVVNKSTLEGETLSKLTWGAAQLGIAQGVLDVVHEGILEAADVPELLLLVAVWVDPAAHEERAVRTANRRAVGRPSWMRSRRPQRTTSSRSPHAASSPPTRTTRAAE